MNKHNQDIRKEDYQAAFSWVEPSQEALDRALELALEPAGRRRPRLGTLLVAAIGVLVLLTGGVFAASRWLSLEDAAWMEREPVLEKDAPEQPEQAPAPQKIIQMSGQTQQNYLGFTLPEAYRDRADQLNCWMLRAKLETDQLLDRLPEATDLEGVYLRYYGADAEGGLLTVELSTDTGLGQRAYFTRGSFEVTKEGSINGLEASWIVHTDAQGAKSWHLFCRSQEPAGVLIFSSNRSFAAAEEAAKAVRLVDSGVALDPLNVGLFYGVRRPQAPEGMVFAETAALDRELLNTKLTDPDQDLSQLYRSLYALRSGTGERLDFNLHQPSRGLKEDPLNFTVDKIGEINGHEAWWCTDRDGWTELRIYFAQEHCVLVVFASAEEMENHPDELEAYAAGLELVPIGVEREQPLEFNGFAVG